MTLTTDKELLSAIEREYGFPALLPVSTVGFWGEHVRYKVQSADGRAFIVKEKSYLLNPEEYWFHIKVHLHLQNSGVAVDCLEMTKDKIPVLRWMGRLYEVHEWIPSVPFVFEDPYELESAGTLVASFISSSSQYSVTAEERSWDYPSHRAFFAPDTCRDIEGYLIYLEKAITRMGGWKDPRTYQRLLGYLSTANNALVTAALPEQIIHGDIQRFNFLHGYNGRDYIIDFERTHWGYRLADIVCGCVMAGAVNAPDNQPQASLRAEWCWDNVAALLRGYTSIQILAESEKRYFSTLLTMYLIRSFIGALDLDNVDLLPPTDLHIQIDTLISLLDSVHVFSV